MAYVYYNLTNLTNAGNNTNVLTFVSGVNNLMNGVPALLILIAIGILLFMTLHSQGVDPFRNFSSTSFVTLVLSLILYPTGLISGDILLIFAILFPVSVFILWVFGGTQYG